METFDDLSEKIWQVIHVICELWAFFTIVWIICPKYWKENMNFFFRRLFRKIKFIDESSVMGQLLLDDIKLITGVDKDYNLIISIDKSPLKVDEDFVKVAHKLEEENSVRLEQGMSPVYTDLFPYAVHNILPYRKGVHEEPECKITLRKSSYFYSLVSIMAMDEKIGDTTIREKYYKELLTTPSEATPNGYDIVHGFGMNTMVLTKDHSFVFSKRNRNTVSTGQGKIHVSVGEHLNGDVLGWDKNRREPCATETIAKGILQELGIEISDEEKANIRFYAVGFSKSVCQYGILGFTHLDNYSNEEILRAWERSKDGLYESEELVFVDANIKSIIDYLNTNENVYMTKFALLNVCLALMMESELGNKKQEELEKELKKLRPNALVG